MSENHLYPPKTICNHPKSSTTIQKHPLKNICNHPKPTITTQNHPQSGGIFLKLAATGLKPSISMSEHPQSFKKHLRPTLVFMWNSALRQKFNFCFSVRFLLVLTKFSFWEGDWGLGNNSMKIWHVCDISWFP